MPLHAPMRRALLLALLVGAAGCRKPDSILLVEVAGSVLLKPTQFRVTATAGLQNRLLLVPPDPGDPVQLPTSFSIELDRSQTGPITISIDALDESHSTIACGNAVQQHIEIGGQTVITVVLNACNGGGDDGGAGGQGGGGGQAGAGGAGGNGGGAGGRGGQVTIDGGDLDAAQD